MPFTLRLKDPPTEASTNYLGSFGSDLEWSITPLRTGADLFIMVGSSGHVTAEFSLAERKISIEIDVVGANALDPLMMVLQSLLAPCLQPSFTGAAFVDWEDIKAALVSAGGDYLLNFSSDLSEARQVEAPPIIVVAVIGTEMNTLQCARGIYSRYLPDIFSIQLETRHLPRGILTIEAR